MQADARIARNYLAFDKVIQKIRQTLKEDLCKGFSGYSANALVDNLTQRVVLNIFQPYMDVATKVGDESDVITLSGLIVDIKTGKVKIKAQKLFSLMSRFYLLWIVGLGAILLPVVNRKRICNSLVYGVPSEYISEDLNEYCTHGPIEELNNSKRLFFQVAGKHSRLNDRIYLHRLPLVSAVLKSPLGLFNTIIAVIIHLSVLFSFTLRTLINPMTSLLWMDFAQHSHAYILNKNKLLDVVVFTNSNMMQQFLWMNCLPQKKFKTLMALYSLNSHYFVLKDDPVYAINPAMRMVSADEILVWNSEYGAYLKNEGLNVPTRVVWPVVWQNYRELTHLRSNNEIVIGVFDVSPLSLEYQRQHGFEGFYYSKEVVIAFIDGLIDVVNNLQSRTKKTVRIKLKHKRTPSPSHDLTYFEHIDSCVRKHDNFEVISSNTNIFDFVSSCDMLVVIPYSSPVYIGEKLGVPSIYFDPTEKLLATYMEMENVSFAAGQDRLLQTLVNKLMH